ncbi:unnamed protein product, partial [Candidula unifasciata]
HVHISSATKEYLNGDYDLIPGNGHERDSYIKALGIQTFLISTSTRRHKAFDNTREHISTGALKRMGIEEKGQFSVKPDLMFSDHILCQLIIITVLTVSELIFLDRHLQLLVVLPLLVTLELILFLICCCGFVPCLPLHMRLAVNTFFGRRLFTQCILAASTCVAFLAVLLPMLYLATPDLESCLTEKYGNFSRRTVQLANITLNSKRTICNPSLSTSFFPENFLLGVVVVMLSTSVYLESTSLAKLILTLFIAVVFLLLIQLQYVNLFINRDYIIMFEHGSDPSSSAPWIPLKWEAIFIIAVTTIILFLHAQQVESTARLDFIWKIQAQEEKEQMESLRDYNLKLLSNILPLHVAKHFLKVTDYTDLYYEDINNVGVMFASIVNFAEFYTELEANNEGVECLRLLNEIIADFDTLLSNKRFSCVEKIKTVGQTYMCASGLTSRTNFTDMTHILALADYTFALQKQLHYINENSFNNFLLRIGLNVGPVVAGVIGVKKPHYDIWGNTVNVASRMDSTGLPSKIQVTMDMYSILSKYGYALTLRGIVKVKGKGDMQTYFLDSLPPHVSIEDVLVQ